MSSSSEQIVTGIVITLGQVPIPVLDDADTAAADDSLEVDAKSKEWRRGE